MIKGTFYTEKTIDNIIDDLNTIKDELDDVTSIEEARGISDSLDDIIIAIEDDCYDAEDIVNDIKSEMSNGFSIFINEFFDDVEL